MLKEAMRALSENLRSSLRRSSLIEHALTKGEIREQDVTEAFRPHLPRRYELSSGIIVNAAGEQSQQQDLVISDSHFVPPFIASGGIGVHPVETVSGVFEIKSRADTAAIRDGVQKISSVKKLSSDQRRSVGKLKTGSLGFYNEVVKPFGAILCLESKASTDTLVETYLESVRPLPAIHRPNALLVLDTFTALWGRGANEYSFLTRPDGAERLMQWEAGPDSLLLFYLVLLAALLDAPQPELDLAGYLEHAQVPAQGRWYPIEPGGEPIE